MNINLKFILIAVGLFVAAFCAFGFLATFKPIEPGKRSGVLFLCFFNGVMVIKCLGRSIGMVVSFLRGKFGRIFSIRITI
ncbi:MAG: hypothetical protein VX104_02085 [Planctomycetota bacterium]|nr:hypothetical protein [Planctomycetota bacterium]